MSARAMFARSSATMGERGFSGFPLRVPRPWWGAGPAMDRRNPPGRWDSSVLRFRIGLMGDVRRPDRVHCNLREILVVRRGGSSEMVNVGLAPMDSPRTTISGLEIAIGSIRRPPRLWRSGVANCPDDPADRPGGGWGEFPRSPGRVGRAQ